MREFARFLVANAVTQLTLWRADIDFESDCTDGLDNDEDGLTDCDDPDCADNAQVQVCGGGGGEVGPDGRENTDEACGDGVDNDGDGLIDCADQDCFGNPRIEACAGEVGGGSEDTNATCADGVVLTGIASGTFIDGLLTVQADGLATSTGVQCTFDLSGTARVVGDHIEIDYTGTSCLGPVSGSETLTR